MSNDLQLRNVSKIDNLSAKERQELLAEIIDLNILKPEKIVSHIDFALRTHPLPKDDIPRLKWEQDRKFVENYKANPSRFLIATLK